MMGRIKDRSDEFPFIGKPDKTTRQILLGFLGVRSRLVLELAKGGKSRADLAKIWGDVPNQALDIELVRIRKSLPPEIGLKNEKGKWWLAGGGGTVSQEETKKLTESFMLKDRLLIRLASEGIVSKQQTEEMFWGGYHNPSTLYHIAYGINKHLPDEIKIRFEGDKVGVARKKN